MNLKELDDKAAPGTWQAARVAASTASSGHSGDYAAWVQGAGPRPVQVDRSVCMNADDMDFICAMVNAYRDGELVERRTEERTPPQRYGIYPDEAYGDPYLDVEEEAEGEWVRWSDIASHFGPDGA